MGPQFKTPVSFEFFPPRDASGRESLAAGTAKKLAALKPQYFSVTSGAGGSAIEGTKQTVTALMKQGWETLPHMSVGAINQGKALGLMAYYKKLGVKKILCLRGDQRESESHNPQYAEDLVRLIRQHFGDHFEVVVAAYPEVHPDSASGRDDLAFFKRKVDAGTDVAITQYFYNVDAYEYFVQQCRNIRIDIPIIPGVMPITNYASLCRFSEKAGADIPRWLDRAMAQRQDSESELSNFGVEVVSRLCERLIDLGAPALHFYTLNRWGATTKICANLGLTAS